MKLLVLGGTVFVGRAVVEAALAGGWSVTTFNRGRTGQDVPGAATVRGDRHDPTDIIRLARTGPWDAVVDASGYVPHNVLSVARALEPVIAHYAFISTVSVYQGWPRVALDEGSAVLECPPDAGADYGVDVEDGPTRYGYQKSGCETAVRSAFGSDRVTVLRPGVVLGPREYVGRLPWWLRRIAMGGPVIAPGEPRRSIQPVDVRDLADFVLACALRHSSGAFNVTAPIGRESFGGLLEAGVTVTGSNADLVWTSEERLLQVGVRQWSELPLWRISEGVWRVDSTKAAAAGLGCRPLARTVADTWRWMTEPGADVRGGRDPGIGLTADHERQLLALADQ